MLMFTYISYYNIASYYLCELISRKEGYMNTCLGTDHHQLLMPPISKYSSDILIERSFIYAAPCEWNKFRIESHIQYCCLQSYYNIAPTYICELISRRESSVNTRLGSDQHQLIMPPISKDCSNTFLER